MVRTEIILEIYKFCDIETRLTLNKIFKWSYKMVNPLQDKLQINGNKFHFISLNKTLTYILYNNWNSFPEHYLQHKMALHELYYSHN